MNTVLFDLDGTLLPMDMKEFTDTYILLLKNRLETAGYDAKKIIAALWADFPHILQLETHLFQYFLQPCLHVHHCQPLSSPLNPCLTFLTETYNNQYWALQNMNFHM